MFKPVFAQLHERADRPGACGFLEALIEVCTYLLHTILTDNILYHCLGI
jgi:hypothetical protein